jgi:hypothetical protein
MPKKARAGAVSQSEIPAWQVLQERMLAVVDDYSEENPSVPDALLLTGAGLAYVTFAVTRYGDDAYRNVYDNLRSIVQLFQRIIDDEKKDLLKAPKRMRSEAPDNKKRLEKKWTLLESIRVKLNQMVEQEITRLQESPKAN